MGIPVVQITPVDPVARAVGSNRVVRGQAITAVLGDEALQPQDEREMRRRLVASALEMLATDRPVGISS